nr:hypothetical protein [Chlamydiota bacterium]
QDCLALFLPEDENLIRELPRLRTLYPREQITVFVPKILRDKIALQAEIHSYTHLSEVLRDDLRFKLIYNFTGNFAIDRYYKKRATQIVAHPKDFDALEKLVRNA